MTCTIGQIVDVADKRQRLLNHQRAIALSYCTEQTHALTLLTATAPQPYSRSQINNTPSATITGTTASPSLRYSRVEISNPFRRRIEQPENRRQRANGRQIGAKIRAKDNGEYHPRLG